MKLKVSNLLTALAAVLALTLTAKAQEETPIPETQDPTRRELNLNEDKTLIYDRSTHIQGAKDSIQSPRQVVPPITHTSSGKVTKPDASKNQKDGNDDALSFNFLYYMLQKYKLADLIDQ